MKWQSMGIDESRKYHDIMLYEIKINKKDDNFYRTTFIVSLSVYISYKNIIFISI